MIRVKDVEYGLALEIDPLESGALAIPLQYDEVRRIWVVKLSYKESRALARHLNKESANKR